MPTWLKNTTSDWYTRESFLAEDTAGCLGRKQAHKAFVLMWCYISDFISNNGHKVSPFVHIGSRRS